jgi:hypothetical protein
MFFILFSLLFIEREKSEFEKYAEREGKKNRE